MQKSGGELNWNGSLDPVDATEINCYAVMVTAPDMKGASCEMQDSSIRSVGMAAGLFPSGSEVSIQTRAGSNRQITLVGLVADGNACKSGFGNIDATNLSFPYVVGETTTNLKPGFVEVEIPVEVDPSPDKIISKCSMMTVPPVKYEVNVDSLDITEGNSDVVVVEFDEPVEKDLHFSWSIPGASSRLSPVSGSAVALAGNDFAMITIAAPQNGSYQGDQNFTFSIAANQSIDGLITAPVTVYDDESAPVVTPSEVNFSYTSTSIPEDNTAYSIQIELSQPAPVGGVHVSYTNYTGTAFTPSDFSMSPGVITIAQGATYGFIIFTAGNDGIYETNETVGLMIMAADNGVSVGPNATYSVTIPDAQSLPQVQWTTSTSSHSENTGLVTVTAQLSNPSAFTASVDYSVSGSATYPGDHNIISDGTLNFATLQTSAQVIFSINNDAVTESSENVVFTLNNPMGAGISGTSVHTLTINDDDVGPSIAFGSPSQTVPESHGAFSIPVILSTATPLSQTIAYTTGGTASWGSDYSQSGGYLTFAPGVADTQYILVSIIDDVAYEPGGEDLVLTLGAITGGQATPGAILTHTVHISDNDVAQPAVQFGLSSSSFSENSGVVSIAVSIASAPTADQTITYSVGGGDATWGTDYSASGSAITFANGSTATQYILVTLTDDASTETNEQFNIALTGGGTIGSPATHTVTINDNDVATTVQFTMSASSVSESAGSFSIPISISAAPGGNVTVNYSVTGGSAAGSGVDYTLSAGQVTFASGSAVNKYAVVALNDDTFYEGNETVQVTLAPPSGSTLGPTSVFTLTINDNESSPLINFSASSQTVGEAAGVVPLTVSMVPAASINITVPFTVAGTATYGTDHGLSAGSLTFAAGATSQTLNISVTDDASTESSETAIVNLGTPSLGSTGGIPTFTLTITDNDALPAPTVTAINPNTVPLVGGIVVTITGNNFQPGITASFSGDACTSPVYDSPTQMHCMVPAHIAGTLNVNVLNPDSQTGLLPSAITWQLMALFVAEVKSGYDFTCARFFNGKMKCWGDNSSGQLGQGNTFNFGDAPTTMGNNLPFINLGTGRSAIQFDIGSGFVCALLDNNSIKCWGANTFNQLGVNDNTNPHGDQSGEMGNSLMPVNLGGTTGTPVEVQVGSAHACARFTSGNVYCWGYGGNGELGNGGTSSSVVPMLVSGGYNAAQLDVGGDHACLLTTAGAAYCWGSNSNGQLGDGTTNTTYVPVAVSGGLTFAQISTSLNYGGTEYNTCGVTTSGAAYCWGKNTYGQIGDGTLTQRIVPTAVSGLSTNVVRISVGGASACATLTNGTAKCWGSNNFGALGVGSGSGYVSTPGTVYSLTNFLDVSVGNSHACGRFQNNRIRCWGNAASGELGYENATSTGSSNGSMSSTVDVDLGNE